ncbi:M1 family metallopeptidase [Flavobacterium aurantiibacter]|uniref:Peptidase M1 n=1 Tax=Flavobacterium aurantiibacter TaxID=2023067 RepID=A0A256A565_9FLAO|nr:M1 family metallopeptidase [Flavobacterium aurantiibacter]OYQ48190.1 peptidase M1 [Flavobacterium aurantiibacter]
MMKYFSLLLLSCGFTFAQATHPWQQHVDYKINVDFDVKSFQYTGEQTVVYKNNSPDDLNTVFIHLYPNAFQPGSEMDIRLQNNPDPDRRMATGIKEGDKERFESRIAKLQPNEIGLLELADVRCNGQKITVLQKGTLAQLLFSKPIKAGEKVTFKWNFKGQLPVQIRRSGRNNKEGIAISMSQWYPKIAAYDTEGWHANAYIAREFYGEWGNFDVKIAIDKNYTIGGTGILQNPTEIGHGYSTKFKQNVRPDGKLVWHFKAEKVHDFTWAADDKYIHDQAQLDNGTVLHFFYKDNPKILENWKGLQPDAVRVMNFYNQLIGTYPYKQYSIIQGGDGGMEYQMCTLILGEGKYDGLLGVTAHEMGHAWFQGLLASNESKYAWMDEGFTSYIEDLALAELKKNTAVNPFTAAYTAVAKLQTSGKEQALTTHADRFEENRSYSVASYFKGQLFLTQLQYLLGKDQLIKGLKTFFDEFKFKHPTPNDLVRILEKQNNVQLDWFVTDWTQTTNKIDYAVTATSDENGRAEILVTRKGLMPMPQQVLVELKNGTSEYYCIPLREMHGNPKFKGSVQADWPWAQPQYRIKTNVLFADLKRVLLDPDGFVADTDRANDIFVNEK